LRLGRFIGSTAGSQEKGDGKHWNYDIAA
jgi:hypothetical protein